MARPWPGHGLQQSQNSNKAYQAIKGPKIQSRG
jgi:hypothetical protein